MRAAALSVLVVLLTSTGALAQSRNITPQAKPELFVQFGHLDGVDAVAFSRDGRMMASADSAAIKLWDVASGRELRTLRVSSTGFAWSPDGQWLVSAVFAHPDDKSNVLKVWDVATGRDVRTLAGHAEAVTSVAFAPDGRVVASGGADRTVKLWDFASGREMRTLGGHAAPVRSVAFSPDGRTIASGSEDKTVRLWDVASGRPIRTVGPHADPVRLVAFSPDGRSIATGSQSNASETIRIWETASGRALHAIDPPPVSVAHSVAFAFSPDGRALASTAGDGSVRLWDPRSGKALTTWAGHPNAPVTSVAFSPDGRRLATGSGDRLVKLWDVAARREVRTFGGRAAEVWAVAFSPDARMIATVTREDAVKLWDVPSGRELRSFGRDAEKVTALAFSPKGNIVATGRLDDSVKLWDVATGRELRTLSHPHAVWSVAFSPDGAVLATGGGLRGGGDDHFLKLWDVASGRELRSLGGHADAVLSLAFSGDGRTLAAGISDGVTKLWDVATGREVASLSQNVSAAALALSADGRTLVASAGRTVKVWDVANKRELRSIGTYAWAVFSLALSPDGRMVVAGAADGTVRVSEIASGRELWRSEAGYPGGTNPVAFSPDGRTVAAATARALSLFDAASGKERVALIPFSDGSSLAVTPEGYYDASSPAAEENVNVRVGTQVFGIGAYREKFYRPDLVNLALAGRSLSPFARLDDVKLAPRVDLIDVPATTNAPQLTVKIRLTDGGGGVGDVRVFLNGSGVVQQRGRDIVPQQAPGAAVEKTFTVRLVNGKNELRVVAFNADNSMQSNPAIAEIQANLALTRPSLYGVVVGIQDFKNPALTLKYPTADARLFADVLRRLASRLFRTVDLTLLTTPQETTRDSVLQALQNVRQKVEPDDLFVFFVASHGTVDDGEYFLVTSNVGSASTAKLKTDAVSQSQLKELIGNIPATKKLVVIDTCNAGALGDSLQVALLTRGMSDVTAMKILGRAVGSTVLSASTSTQQALEGYRGHGLFTYVLAEGLQGKADANGDGVVSTLELATYVDDRVPALAEQVFKHAQYPIVSPSGQGFPLVKVK